MLPRIALLIAVALALLSAGAVRAQSTPTTDSALCTVEPRTDEQIAAIKATPIADGEMGGTPDAAQPVDEETVAELEQVIAMADACAAAGDYNRLAALYSEQAIRAGVLDGAELPIEEGTPPATPTSSEPPGKFGPPNISIAYRIDETHVLAEVERGPRIHEVRFAQEDGAWLIDSNETVIGEVVDDAPGSPDASNVLPIEVMQSIIDLIALETGDEVQTITITSVEGVDWPDTSLGCPVEGMFYAQVITPGYRVTVEHEGQSFEVHTDLAGHAVPCEPA